MLNVWETRAHPTGRDHRVDAGLGNAETVFDVGAGDVERHARAGRNLDRGGREREDVGDVVRFVHAVRDLVQPGVIERRRLRDLGRVDRLHAAGRDDAVDDGGGRDDAEKHRQHGDAEGAARAVRSDGCARLPPRPQQKVHRKPADEDQAAERENEKERRRKRLVARRFHGPTVPETCERIMKKRRARPRYR